MSVLYLVDGDKARVVKGKTRNEAKRRIWFLTREPDFNERAAARNLVRAYDRRR